jgi:enamine deaminase RidA (YjgF/YER057c/UK114 family)
MSPSSPAARVARALVPALVGTLAGCMPPMPPGGPEGGPGGGPAPALDPAALAPKGVSPKGVPHADGFSAATRANGVVYLSTQLPAPAPGTAASRDLLLQQADQVFGNLNRTTLAAGAFPPDLVRLTLYTRGLGDGDLEALRPVLQTWFPTADPPALSIVTVAAFPVEGALLAADGVVAMRPSAKR